MYVFFWIRPSEIRGRCFWCFWQFRNFRVRSSQLRLASLRLLGLLGCLFAFQHFIISRVIIDCMQIMSTPDANLDAEALEAAVWVFRNLPEDMQQLAIDGVDPNDPLISAVR